jgi:hypothetical protein
MPVLPLGAACWRCFLGLSALALVLAGVAACGPAAGGAARAGSGPPPDTVPAVGRRPAGTLELQALARAEEQRFARAVAAEPAAERLGVAAVSPAVLVEPARRAVYVLRPHLVALDLTTGRERWELAAASGGSLWRVGRDLVVLGAESPLRPRLFFHDPDTPRRPQTCVPALPAPREAESVALLPFERAGKVYLFWRSRGHYRRGGPPPGAEETRRARAGDACGVVALEPRTCAVTPVPLRPFLLSPPRDDGAAVPIAPDDCRYLSPLRHFPAAAASVAPPWAPPAGGAAGGVASLRVVTAPLPRPGGGCVLTEQVTLEARDAAGALLWSYRLPDATSAGGCPGPP